MGFIVDFYCHKAKLVIEIDGATHQSIEQKEYDMDRTEEMKRFGIRVIRFTNEQVINSIELVLEDIRQCVR